MPPLPMPPLPEVAPAGHVVIAGRGSGAAAAGEAEHGERAQLQEVAPRTGVLFDRLLRLMHRIDLGRSGLGLA